MPEDGVPPRSHDEILRFEEIADVVRVAVRIGISRFRLTGGEPLVRVGIVDLVSMIASVPGVIDLAMSTNGSLLEECAQPLRDAGLHSRSRARHHIQGFRRRAARLSLLLG